MFSTNYGDVNYDYLLAEAGLVRRLLGRPCSVNDLLAMTTAHDPFYRGTKTDIKKAAWFSAVWKKLGLDAIARGGKRVHLRRVHYMVVSRSAEMPRVTWGGSPGPYLNTEEHWDDLRDAAMNARYLRKVRFMDIEDNRNPDPRLNTSYRASSDPAPWVSVEQKYTVYAYMAHAATLLSGSNTPQFELHGYEPSGDHYHLEVWVEKSTMEDVLLPVCQLWHANLLHAAGDLSITQVFEAARRVAKSRRPARIFYISDFDPAGQRMPVSAGRKLEWFIHSADSPLRDEFDAYLNAGCDVTLTPLALTEEQCEKYDLPKQPLKAQGGKDQWELLHGEGATELDALEALHPGELANIVSDCLSEFHDSTLRQQVREAKTEVEQYLAGLQRKVMDEHKEALTALVSEYRALYEDVGPRVDAINDALEEEIEAIKSEMEEAAEELDIGDEFPVPEADESEDDDPYEALLWSKRSYDEQLEAYHEFQRRDDLRGAA